MESSDNLAPEPQADESAAQQQSLAAVEQAILELVRRPGYQPVKPRVIAKRLGIEGDAVDDVKRAVKRLIRAGQLVFGAKHMVRPVGAPAETAAPPRRPRASRSDGRVAGVFRRIQAGAGFVRPTGVATEPGTVDDIYIPAPDTADAATGDSVLVQILSSREGRHPGPRGRIVEIVERETHQFVGTYFERSGSAYVQVDGKLFTQPVYVGDPGAKSAQPGDKVVFEMVRFPSYVRDGEGVITEVLGPHGSPGVDTLSVIREFDLPEIFADDALDESRREAERFDESSLDGRLDLTAETVVTIDPVDARDFDDAISLEPVENGHLRLGVHIADVSHFVRPKTALDREAAARSTSTYLPDRVIPMLPEIISNGLASLQPGKVRYTKTAFLEFTPDGVLVDTEFRNSAIRSTRRLTYEEVDVFLADPTPWRRKWGVKVHDLLDRMHKLAMILRARRLGRGALELTMPEVKVDLDRDGRVTGAHVVANTESHQIIEEFMLAANEAVANLLHAKGFRFLRRIHKQPSQRKLDALEEFVAALGIGVDSLEGRFELQRLLGEVAGRPEQYAVNYAVLRSMQRAIYSPAEEGHYALASDCYCHFTSPIRRYPDLTIHRLFDAVLSGRKPHETMEQLAMLAQHCSDQEQRAEAAERELTKLKLLYYLSDRIGEEMEGIITGVESWGMFVQGIELPAEGLVAVAAMSDDYYTYDRAAHTLMGRRAGNTFRLGDKVRVAVARVDLERRELDFRLVQHEARKAPRGRPERKHRKAVAPKKRAKDKDKEKRSRRR
jgi:ribonuclease R